MTQAFNLSQFANKLNSSGQTDNTGLQNSSITINTTSPITGGASTALGSSVTLAHANSGVTANTYTAATITVNAQGHITSASSNTVGAGTVTSVATGNGLSGGTISTSGTLSVACPTANTVGSYSGFYTWYDSAASFTVTYGSNYAAGTNRGQCQAGGVGKTWESDNNVQSSNSLSGTWKYLGATLQISLSGSGGGHMVAIGCRVS